MTVLPAILTMTWFSLIHTIIFTGQFETPGLGFLRLHSTFRHDLKIYASDEGRVQMTAAAFTKVWYCMA